MLGSALEKSPRSTSDHSGVSPSALIGISDSSGSDPLTSSLAQSRLCAIMTRGAVERDEVNPTAPTNDGTSSETVLATVTTDEALADAAAFAAALAALFSAFALAFAS